MTRIFRRLFNFLLRRQQDKTEPARSLNTDRAKKLLDDINQQSPFPRPVVISMTATQTIRDPEAKAVEQAKQIIKDTQMAQAKSRAARDAKKTAVKGSVSSTSRSETRPADPLLDPLNPLNPLNPMWGVGESDNKPVNNHTHHSSHSHHDSHSNHDYGSSSHSSHDSGGYDSGSHHSSHDSW